MVERIIAGGLLTIAAATDLIRRRIYRLWSGVALVTGATTVALTGRWNHLAVAGLLFAGAYVLWTRGGIGGGDVWLVTYLGLVLGVEALPALLIGSSIGALVGVGSVITRRATWNDPLPAGFFWSAGGLLMLMTGWRIWPA